MFHVLIPTVFTPEGLGLSRGKTQIQEYICIKNTHLGIRLYVQVTVGEGTKGSVFSGGNLSSSGELEPEGQE